MIWLLLFAGAGLAGAATIVGPSYWEVRSEVFVPSGVAPNIGDSWSDRTEDEIDKTYAVTITGGTGTGLLGFEALAQGTAHFLDSSRVGSLASQAGFGVPIGIWSPPVWPQGSAWTYCSCYLEFTFDMPFTMTVWGYSEAGFNFTRYREDQTPFSGTITSVATLQIRGVDPVMQDGLAVENAVVTVAETPEPGTIVMIASGLLVAGVSQRRKRRSTGW